MLRFHSTPSAQEKESRGFARRESRRLWFLLLSLGLVVFAIKHFKKPSTIQQLEMIFSPTTEQDSGEIPPAIVVDEVPISSPERHSPSMLEELEAVASRENESSGTESPQDYSLVQDNAPFLTVAKPVWFSLFGRLQKMSLDDLDNATVGEVSCIQLLKQPDSYRGKIVTVRGTVLREEVEIPASNRLGIEAYHRLWVRPRGGGATPFVIYALELPSAFPHGDNLNCDVAISGCFFKNWSYVSEDEMALAPVILTKGFRWQAPAFEKPVAPISNSTLFLAISGASVVGISLAWFAYLRTQRPPRVYHQAKQVSLPEDWEATTTANDVSVPGKGDS